MSDEETFEVEVARDTRMLVIVASTVVGCAMSFGLGYILGKREAKITVVPAEEPEDNQLTIPFKTTVEDIYEAEAAENPPTLIIDAKDYSAIDSSVDEADVLELSPAATERLLEVVLAEEPKVVVEELTVVNNVFHRENDTWDDEAERNSRTGEHYIISMQEFVENGMNFTQETVTYYAGDDIMADATETPIYNYAGIMGELRFGHGSDDSNVVYIRNEKLRREWEVLRYNGSFELEQQGIEAEREAEESELRHSAVPKFRRD